MNETEEIYHPDGKANRTYKVKKERVETEDEKYNRLYYYNRPCSRCLNGHPCASHPASKKSCSERIKRWLLMKIWNSIIKQ